MADASRVRLVWSGTQVVGESVSTFYTLGTPSALMSALHTWLSAYANRFPVGLVLAFEGSGEVIDTSTGQATAAWSATPPAIITGSDSGNFVQGVGLRVVWNTGTFSHGRRIKGSTFLVPTGGSVFALDGTPAGAVIAAMEGGANTVVSSLAGDLVIVTRPTDEFPVGGHASVTSATIPDKVSWLRSRRT